jgi:hypothetical protein
MRPGTLPEPFRCFGYHRKSFRAMTKAIQSDQYRSKVNLLFNAEQTHKQDEGKINQTPNGDHLARGK